MPGRGMMKIELGIGRKRLVGAVLQTSCLIERLFMHLSGRWHCENLTTRVLQFTAVGAIQSDVS